MSSPFAPYKGSSIKYVRSGGGGGGTDRDEGVTKGGGTGPTVTSRGASKMKPRNTGSKRSKLAKITLKTGKNRQNRLIYGNQ